MSRLFEPAGPGPEQALVAEQFRATYNFALTANPEVSPMSMVIGEISCIFYALESPTGDALLSALASKLPPSLAPHAGSIRLLMGAIMRIRGILADRGLRSGSRRWTSITSRKCAFNAATSGFCSSRKREMNSSGVIPTTRLVQWVGGGEEGIQAYSAEKNVLTRLKEEATDSWNQIYP
jgi:hypothetical protein